MYDIERPHVEHARCDYESQFARHRTNTEREGDTDATGIAEGVIKLRQRVNKTPVARQHRADRAPRRRGQGDSPARLQHTVLARCLGVQRTPGVLDAGCETLARRVHVVWMVEGQRNNVTLVI